MNKEIRKSKRAMGFVLRNSKTFRGIRTFRILYCALTRSHMKFGVLVWNPVLRKHSNALEKIQHWFLRYLYLRICQYYPTDVNYAELLQGFQMESLENQHMIAELNILQRNTDPTMCKKINLRIPISNVRLEETSHTHHLQKGPHLYSKLGKMPGNEGTDILSQSKNDFRSVSRRIINSNFWSAHQSAGSVPDNGIVLWAFETRGNSGQR